MAIVSPSRIAMVSDRAAIPSSEIDPHQPLGRKRGLCLVVDLHHKRGLPASALDFDVNPLTVACQFRESIDHFLADGQPAADAYPLADPSLCVFDLPTL